MKKGFTVLEMMVYIFIVSVVGLYVGYISSRFFDSIRFNNNVKVFSQNYNNFLSDIYGKAYNGWTLTGTSQTGAIALYSSGVGYAGYLCTGAGVLLTTTASTQPTIDWNSSSQFFSGFICNSLTGSSVYSGYWININLSIDQRKLNLNYYLQN